MEAELGTLYDANKQFVKQQEPMNKGTLHNTLIQVRKFLENRHDKKYYMLLCNERKDYTVFNILEPKKEHYNGFISELKVCLQNRGDIVFIDETEDKKAYEVWLKINNEAFCYYLFPYNEGVIEV